MGLFSKSYTSEQKKKRDGIYKFMMAQCENGLLNIEESIDELKDRVRTNS